MSHRILFLLSVFLLMAGIYLSRGVLMPVILSAVFAYLLLPAKRFLLKKSLSQTLGTLIVFFPSLGLFILFLAFMIPFLQDEFMNFMALLPHYGQLISERVADWQSHLNQHEILQKFSELQVDLISFVPDVLVLLKNTLLRLLNNTSLIADFILYLALVPLFTFYFLRDAEAIFAKLMRLVPNQYRKTVSSIFTDIDGRLVSYVRGQFILGFIFTIYYMIFLSACGLKHALVISVLTGIFFFVPVLTFYISFFVALTIAYLQYEFSWPFFGVMGVYIVGQILENFILVPKIMEKKLGLSPIWIILALYIGGATMGIIGILISIPVAAILDVLIHHGLRLYYASNYYAHEGAEKKPKRRS